MGHENLAGALVELMQIGKTSPGADPVLHHPPKTLDGIEVVSTPGRQELEPKLLMPVGQCGRKLVRAVNATAVDDHDDLFPSMTKKGHDLMNILPKPLCIKLGDHLIEDFRGAILDGAHDAQQHTAGHTAPTPITAPRLAFVQLFVFDLAAAQGPRGQTIPLDFVPPACSRQGKTPDDRFVFVEQNDLTPTRSVLQGGQFARGPRQRRGVRSEPPRGAAVADVFFLRPRGRSHG
jgi:hypothetical protein